MFLDIKIFGLLIMIGVTFWGIIEDFSMIWCFRIFFPPVLFLTYLCPNFIKILYSEPFPQYLLTKFHSEVNIVMIVSLGSLYLNKSLLRFVSRICDIFER